MDKSSSYHSCMGFQSWLLSLSELPWLLMYADRKAQIAVTRCKLDPFKIQSITPCGSNSTMSEGAFVSHTSARLLVDFDSSLASDLPRKQIVLIKSMRLTKILLFLPKVCMVRLYLNFSHIRLFIPPFHRRDLIFQLNSMASMPLLLIYFCFSPGN